MLTQSRAVLEGSGVRAASEAHRIACGCHIQQWIVVAGITAEDLRDALADHQTWLL
ncbi:hypothetical protein PQR71_22790 [Paraburkholderia fungorum]|uniref:hypothetical protein n=1 Tax=Paraburkholderia fungorum TaxID=134537 RepID=UPI0038BCD6BC